MDKYKEEDTLLKDEFDNPMIAKSIYDRVKSQLALTQERLVMAEKILLSIRNEHENEFGDWLCGPIDAYFKEHS